MRLLGVGDRPRRLLAAVDGLTLVDLPRSDACCGFGGTFAVKNADTSVAMGDDKVDDVLGSGAEVLTAGDTSCLMHIGGLLSRRRSPVRVMHLAEILASTGDDGERARRVGRDARGRPADRPEPSFRGTPPFPEAARTALADDQLRANLGRATATIRTKRAAVVAERADWEALRLAGTAIKDEVLRDLPALLEQLERAVTAAGGTVHWARDAAEANAIVASIARGRRRDRGRQGQVDGDPGDRAQRGAPARGHRRLGDRPRRDDRPARPRPAVAHPRARHPPQPDRDPRHLHRRDGTGRAARPGRPVRRAAGAGRGGPAPPAREVPARAGRRLGRQLRGRRHGHGRRRRVGGQRADVPDPARGADHGHGHREARPDLGATWRSSSSSCRARRPPSG